MIVLGRSKSNDHMIIVMTVSSHRWRSWSPLPSSHTWRSWSWWPLSHRWRSWPQCPFSHTDDDHGDHLLTHDDHCNCSPPSHTDEDHGHHCPLLTHDGHGGPFHTDGDHGHICPLHQAPSYRWSSWPQCPLHIQIMIREAPF